jgi:hypothetical protein
VKTSMKEQPSEFSREEARLLDAIHKTEREMEIPPGVDVRALAVDAVNAYWAERDEVERGKETGLIKETAALARATARRMIDPVWEFGCDLASVIIPAGAALLAAYVVFFKSNFFNETGSVMDAGPGRSIYIFVVIPLGLALYLAVRFFVVKWESYRTYAVLLHHSMGSLVAGLIIAAVIWGLGGYSYRQKAKAVRVSADLSQSSQELRTVSLALAQDQLEEISLKSIAEKQATGEFLVADADYMSVPAARNLLNVTTKKLEPHKVEYKAAFKGWQDLQGELSALVGPDGGAIYYQTPEEREVRTQFVVGRIERLSGDGFNLKVKNAAALQRVWGLAFKDFNTKENSLFVRSAYTPSEFVTGRKVVVALDPSSDTAVATKIDAVNESHASVPEHQVTIPEEIKQKPGDEPPGGLGVRYPMRVARPQSVTAGKDAALIRRP